jgi:uncharacterized protein (TIGR04255 family)
MMDRDRLPTKLKNDAILEAVVEIRFEPDPSLVSEIFIGRFADNKAMSGFRHARLASADIPAQIRRVDPNLRYLPSIEMTSPDGGKVLRIGPQSVAYIRRAPYPGWTESFGNELRNVVDHLYQVAPAVPVSRLGLRYVNALKSDEHGIKGIEDLAIGVSVNKQPLSHHLNLNFKTGVGSDFETITRIASIDLAEGTIPENSTVVVDIDVYTRSTFRTTDVNDVQKWIVEAHTCEKVAFFDVLGEENTERLREK